MTQVMPLPLTVSCFSKIQIGRIFLIPAHPGSPGRRAIKRLCVYVCSSAGSSISSGTTNSSISSSFIYLLLVLFVGHQEEHPACKS